MTKIGPILAVALTLFVTADALACSCAFSCDDKIAVSNQVPQNVKSIAFIPCPETMIGAGIAEVIDDVPEGMEDERPAPIELARKAGSDWKTVEHKVWDGPVKSVGPAKKWKAGQRYRLRVGKTTREFDVEKPLRISDVTVSVKLTGPVVEDVPYAGSPACRRMLRATRYEAQLEFDEKSAQYRYLFVVTQKLNGGAYKHSTSNCSMGRPTDIFRDQQFIIPLKCGEDGVESAELSYEVVLPGLDVPIGVETPPTLKSRCDEEPAPEVDDEPIPMDEVTTDELLADEIAAAKAEAKAESGAETGEPAAAEVKVRPIERVDPDESDEETVEEDSGSTAMVVVGLGLFLVLALIVGWKFSTES